MRPYQRLPALLLAFALVTVQRPAGARAECDSTYVEVSTQVLVGVAAAQEVTATDTLHLVGPGDPPYVADGSGFQRIGLLSRVFDSAVHAENSLFVSGRARDEYRVVGAPAGTEVTFRVRLVGTFDVVFYEYCGGSGCNPVAGLTVDGEDNEHLEFIGIGSYRDQLLPFDRSMTLVRRAGEPFLLSYFTQAGTSHSPVYVGLHAQVEFVDLPPGVRVVSCLEDYVSTETRPATWGSLKARYR